MAASVLLIDDDPDLLPMMAAAFRRAGFTTWSARNGCLGTELFHTEHPDLVVTDMVMSGMEGLEVILELKRNAAPPKIIAISGGGRLGGHDFLKWAKQLGADEVMPKPFRISSLVGAAKRLLGTRRRTGPDLEDAG